MPAKAQSELDAYLIDAGKNNPQLLALFNDYMAALEKIPQVNKLPDPQLAMAYFLQPIETRLGPQRLKLSVNQSIPWFGTLNAAEDQASLDAKSKLELFEEAKSKIFHEIRSSYYSIFLTSKMIDITEQNIDILQTFRRLAMIKIENGTSSQLDDIRLEIEIGDLENQLALMLDQIQTQWKVFDNLVNSDDSSRPDLPKDLPEIELVRSKSDLREIIQQKNHLLLKLEIESSALQAREELANLSGKPNISLGLDYIAVGSGSNNLSGKDALVFPKIGLSIPIYRDKYKAKVQEVVYKQVAKSHEKISKENLLDDLLESAWQDYHDADRRISLNLRQIELSRNALDLLEIEFSANKAPFEEILRMDRKLLGYSLQLEKSKVDKNVAISFINYLMGK